MKPEWLPDWKNPDNYPESMSEKEWRWQFLRRNEEYQTDFEKFHPDYYAEMVETYKNEPLPDGVQSWKEHFGTHAFMPGCREKYGVTILLNPSFLQPSLGLFVPIAPYGIGYTSREKVDEYENNNFKSIVFDLKKPLASQLEKAKKYLSKLQKELVGNPRYERQHDTKWALYLRVLDAKESGATFKDMADTLAEEDGFEEVAERFLAESLRQAKEVQQRFSKPI